MLLCAAGAAEQDLVVQSFVLANNVQLCFKMFTSDLNIYLSYNYVGLNNHYNCDGGLLLLFFLH